MPTKTTAVTARGMRLGLFIVVVYNLRGRFSKISPIGCNENDDNQNTCKYSG
jgi:hypothetical protein